MARTLQELDTLLDEIRDAVSELREWRQRAPDRVQEQLTADELRELRWLLAERRKARA